MVLISASYFQRYVQLPPDINHARHINKNMINYLQIEIRHKKPNIYTYTQIIHFNPGYHDRDIKEIFTKIIRRGRDDIKKLLVSFQDYTYLHIQWHTPYLGGVIQTSKILFFVGHSLFCLVWSFFNNNKKYTFQIYDMYFHLFTIFLTTMWDYNVSITEVEQINHS